MTTAQNTIQLRELIGDQRIAMFSTGTPSGEIHSRPLTLAEIDDDGDLWFFVDSRAEWVTGLKPTDPVNLSFSNHDDRTWVSLSGHAEVREDPARRDRLWSPAAAAFFPDGQDSPYLRLLRVDATSAEYWDAPSSRIGRLALAAKAAVTKSSGALGDSGKIDLH